MDFNEKWISQVFLFIFFPVKCKKVIMMAELKKIGHGLFWPDICVPSQISGTVEHFQKLDGISNQSSLKMYSQNLIAMHI